MTAGQFVPVAEVRFEPDGSEVTVPVVGQVVHYVSRGSADGVFDPQCRAAIVAEVPEGALPLAEDGSEVEFSSADVVVDLVVLNPMGLFFNRCVRDVSGERGGTWHFIDDAVHRRDEP